MEPIHIYTDGSCLRNPGPGGWGAVILADGAELRLSGGERDSTNNRMELTAAIRALAEVSSRPELRGRPVCLHIDSQYVQKGITGWINTWKKNAWRTADKKAVKNRELWQELDALNRALSVEWLWLRGHEGDTYNEICDGLARGEASRQ